MNNNNENSENPLAYVDLYRNGIYIIKEELKAKDFTAVSDSISTENDETSPKIEEIPAAVPTKGLTVLNVIITSQNFDAKLLVNKIMGAVKIGGITLSSNDIELLEFQKPVLIDISNSTQYVLVWCDNAEKLWENKLQLPQNSKVLYLPTAETAAASDDQKRAVWSAIKQLFGMG